MHLLVGSCGFSYPGWRGGFYPEALPQSEMLAFYARRFRTVEINNTFYRPPTREQLTRWCDATPEGFAFVLKAPGRITHELRLVGVEQDLFAFLDATAELEAKLGAVLFQLPPTLRADLPLLRRFLRLLPPGLRAAFQFRNASWFTPAVYELLRTHGKAVCLPGPTSPDGAEAATAGWGYLRLPRGDYEDRALLALRERVEAQPWSEAFVFFVTEARWPAPVHAARLAELVATERPFEPAPAP